MSADPAALLTDIRSWAAELGFARIGVATIDLAQDEARFLDWLRAGFAGEMRYMSRHGSKRTRPAELVPGTVSCISARMDYWPARAEDAERVLADKTLAYVSRYALGRDYHKLMRRRLQEHRRAGEPARLSGVRRQRAGPREGARAQRRARLDRQAHQPHRPPCRILLLHWRDLSEPGAADGRDKQRALRNVQRVFAGLPDGRHRRALSTRCATLHLLSHHRASR